MTTNEPYGAKGCTCFADDVGPDASKGRIAWSPNAYCRYHGLLAGYAPPRAETGTYRVVREDPYTPDPNVSWAEARSKHLERMEREAAEVVSDCAECERYGECLDCEQEREHNAKLDAALEDYRAPMTPEDAEIISKALADPNRPTYRLPPRDFVDTYSNPNMITQEREHGVLAAVRRWARHAGDWLDPVRPLRREWARQRRADLYGRDAGDQGRER